MSNIYAPVVPGYDYVRINPHGGYKGERKRGLQLRTVVCVFLLRGEIVARASSLRILDVEIAELSSLQIRCPIPDHLLLKEKLSSSSSREQYRVKWDSMRLERRLSPHPEHNEVELPNSTVTFNVCNMHRLEAALLPLNPADGLCTGPNRSSCQSASGATNKHLRRAKQGPETQTVGSKAKAASVSSQYLHRLSLCTATSRSSRAQLVEWIEYHK
jgi:hypothetical protein